MGDEMGGRCGTYGRRERHTSFWFGNLIIRDLVRPRHKWVDNIKMEYKGTEWGTSTGLIWHRRGTCV